MKKFYLFLLLAAMLLPWGAKAQLTETYAFTTGLSNEDDSAWITLSSAATQIIAPNAGDYGKSAVTGIGFSFTFGENDYTQFSISADGNLRLGSTVVSTSSYTGPLSSGNLTTHVPFISGLGFDGQLNGNGYCKYELVGEEEGSRVLVVELVTSAYGADQSLFRVQYQLFEGTNAFRLVYGQCVAASNKSPQVGAASSTTDVVRIDMATHTFSTHTSGVSATNAAGANFQEGRWYEMAPDPDLCLRPSGVTASDITETEATLSWLPSANAIAYAVTYNGVTEETDETEITLSDLSASTRYNVQVRSICGDGDTSAAVLFSFATACANITELPWVDNYDDETDFSTLPYVRDCYDFIYNGNYPYCNQNNHYGSTGHCMIMMASSGAAPHIILPPFEEELSNLYLTFHAKSYSSSTTGTMQVGYMTDPTNPSTFVLVQNYTLGSDWGTTLYEALFPEEAEGRIAMRIVPSSSNGAYIDDVTVQLRPECMHPISVSVTGTSETTLGLSISDPQEDVSYRIYYSNGTAIDSVDSDEKTLTLEDLQPSSTYYIFVAALCGDAITSTVSAVANTACGAISALPWTDGFEDVASTSAVLERNCYEFIGSYTTPGSSTSGYPTGNARGANGSQLNYYWYTYTGGSYPTLNIMVLPPFEADLGTLALSFYARSTTTNGCNIEAGYMTNPADSTSFVPVAPAVHIAQSDDYSYHEYAFPSDAEGRIAIRIQTGSGQNALIDDIAVFVAPSCMRPAGVSVDNITSTTATVTINDPTEVGSYRIYWTTGSTTDSADVESTTYQITTLSPSSPYTLSVVALCDDGTVTMPFSTQFNSACGDITALPFTQDFESLTGQDMTTGLTINCWDVILYPNSASYNYPYVMTTNTHSGGRCVYFSGNDTYHPVIILPSFADPIEDLMLTFWAKRGGGSMLRVGYTTSTTSEAAFVAVDTIYPGTDYDYYEFTFPAEATGRIAIQFIKSGSDGINIDDLTVMERPACVRPQGINFADLTENSVTVNINDPDEVNHYMVFYQAEGSSTTDSVEATAASVALSDLTPATDYTVSVVTLCTDGTRTNPQTATVHTPCVALTMEDMPYTYGFEDATGFPTCWTLMQRYSSNYPIVNSSASDAHSGTKYLYSYANASSPNLVATPIMPIAASDLYCTFWVRGAMPGAGLEVGIVTNTADPTSFVACSATATGQTAGNYAEYEFYAAASGATEPVAVAFRWASTTYGYLDDVTITTAEGCRRVANVVASDNDTSSFTLTWNANGNADGISYEVRYGIYNDVDHASTMSETTTETTIELTGLEVSSTYYVWVRAICGEDEVGPWFTVGAVRTTSVPYSGLPYVSGFEPGDDTGWDLYNSSNGWYIGTAVNHGGTSALYISNDNGTSNTYSIGSVAYSYAARTIALPEAGEYALSFDWQAKGEENWDYLRVFLTPGAEQFVAGVKPDGTTGGNNTFFNTVPTGWTDLVGGRLNNKTGWQHIDTTFTVTASGNYNLVFMWLNDGSGGTQPPAAIDNVMLASLTCPKPINLTASDVTDEGFTVSWTPTGEETEWLVSLNGGTPVSVSTTSYTFTGLGGSTEYSVSVQAACSDEDVSVPSVTSVHTACGNIADLPWSDDFDSYPNNSGSTQLEIPCYTILNHTHAGYSSWYPYFNQGVRHSGDHSLFGRSSLTEPVTIVLPGFAADLNTLQVSFWLRSMNATGGTIAVGYVTNTADATSFVGVDTIQCTNEWTEYTVSFSNLSASAEGNIALAYLVDDNNGLYLDDVTVDLSGDEPGPGPNPQPCATPTDVTAAQGTDNITLSWTADGDAEVTLTTGSSWSEPAASAIIQVNTGTYTWNGLTPNTTYTVGVRQVCTENNSEWVTRTVTTSQVGIADVDAQAPDFTIYPNPATRSVTLSGAAEGATVEVISLNGRVMLKAAVRGSETKLDISALASGSYFVRLTSGDATAVRKLIVK